MKTPDLVDILRSTSGGDIPRSLEQQFEDDAFEGEDTLVVEEGVKLPSDGKAESKAVIFTTSEKVRRRIEMQKGR